MVSLKNSAPMELAVRLAVQVSASACLCPIVMFLFLTNLWLVVGRQTCLKFGKFQLGEFVSKRKNHLIAD